MSAARPPEGARRGAFRRALQLIVGVALFLYALRVLTPMPLDRLRFATLAALLAAGSMAVADSAVDLLAAAAARLRRGGRA